MTAARDDAASPNPMTPTGPASSPGVVVVADDLTGAADTAVRFLSPGEEILLVSLADAGASSATLPTAGLAIDTGTRGASEGQAILGLHMAAALVRGREPALVYKKVDSQLRGRPGLEIETLRRELGLRCALVAPAHPDQGRVTVAGVHLVHGVPAAESEAGRDPVAPVAESRLPLLVARQAGVRVAHVPIADVEDGPAALRRTIERLVAEGHQAVTFDAVTPQHLELIAEVACRRFPDALLAGSAGLAAALASRRDTGAALAPALLPCCASLLLVCGSTAGALRRQVARLVASGRSLAVTVTSAGAMAGTCREELKEAALAQWARGDVVLLTPGERLDAAAGAPAALLDGLADLALALVARRRPGGLFLSGGDTAAAVLRAAGVAAIRLRGEAVPGGAWGVAVGGVLDGVTILTRAGAFGGDEDLVELQRRCGKEASHV
jgi:uncharacterized protein YgbK (DUF1537 family)